VEAITKIWTVKFIRA